MVSGQCLHQMYMINIFCISYAFLVNFALVIGSCSMSPKEIHVKSSSLLLAFGISLYSFNPFPAVPLLTVHFFSRIFILTFKCLNPGC